MFQRFLKLIESIIHLGVDSPNEFSNRRITLTNQMAIVGLIFAISGFLLNLSLYIKEGGGAALVLSLQNMLSIGLLAGTLTVNYFKKHYLAKCLFLSMTLFHGLVTSMIFGTNLGHQNLFWIVAPLGMIIFDRTELRLRSYLVWHPYCSIYMSHSS